MKILIVDDSKVMRMIIRRTLRQAGFGENGLTEASNGIEALETLHSTQPDLILCDWNMPEMSGMELLERLHRDGHHVKFGFVTSESSPEMREAAEKAGALFLITKPFTPEVFRSVLDPVLS